MNLSCALALSTLQCTSKSCLAKQYVFGTCPVSKLQSFGRYSIATSLSCLNIFGSWVNLDYLSPGRGGHVVADKAPGEYSVLR